MKQPLPVEPRIVRVSAAGSDILAIQVEEGWIEGGIQIPYQPLDGETLLPDVENPHLIWIDTNGEHTGVLVADEARGDQRFVLETRHGDELSEKADLSSSEDPPESRDDEAPRAGPRPAGRHRVPQRPSRPPGVPSST